MTAIKPKAYHILYVPTVYQQKRAALVWMGQVLQVYWDGPVVYPVILLLVAVF